MKRTPAALAALPALALALTGCGGPSQLEKAADDCQLSSLVQDEGKSLFFDTKGDDDDSGDTIDDVACVLADLDTPQYVIEHIDSTRALDGTQTDQWAEVKARWTYHPDEGLRLALIQING